MDEEFESLCSLLFFSIYRKKVPGKIPIPFLAQKERLDGFSTRRVRFANSLFYIPFCSAKRWTKSSSLSALCCFFQYTEKRYRGKSRYLSCLPHMEKIFQRFRGWEVYHGNLFPDLRHQYSTSASTSSPPIKTTRIFSLDSTTTHRRICRIT